MVAVIPGPSILTTQPAVDDGSPTPIRGLTGGARRRTLLPRGAQQRAGPLRGRVENAAWQPFAVAFGRRPSARRGRCFIVVRAAGTAKVRHYPSAEF